ncbi:MAG: CBS domain-containing protein, partial [Phycisphaerales bacterium]|nr:CBS domain-containing protein [Phycisphaerales bacterium]
RSDTRLSEDELAALLVHGRDEGAIDEGEVSVLRQVIGLGSVRVREVMVPRVDVEWIEDHEPAWERVVELVKRTGLTRVPVVKRGGDLDDDVQGLLNAKRYLAAVARARTGGAPAGDMKAYFEAVTYVPASATLDRALELYRTRGVKTALCVDERGAVVGVVSMTDIARRLMVEMGETNTTQDGSAPSGMSGTAPGDSNDSGVVAISPGRWSVPGRLSVRDWGAMFGVKTDRRVTTIAGLVMDRLGRVPRVGDEVRLGNLVISVQELSGRVADRLEVRLDSGGASA